MKNLSKYIERVELNELLMIDDMHGLNDEIQADELTKSWQISSSFNAMNYFLVMNVNGLFWKNYIIICKQKNNKFRIYLVNKKGEIEAEYKNLPLSDLVYEIDCIIEQPESMSDKEYINLINQYNQKIIEGANERNQKLATTL